MIPPRFLSLRNLGSLGIKQSWKNVTSSRKYNTLYTNNSSLPISVNICIPRTNGYALELLVDNIQVSYFAKNFEGYVGCNIQAIVPPKSTYKLHNMEGSPNFIWTELS